MLPKECKQLDIFVQCVRTQRLICSTEELISLNNRAKEALDEVYIITARMLQGIFQQVRESMG